MGRYCTVDEVRGRYSELDTMAKFDITSYHLPYAEMELDGYMAPYYTVPFSSNNLTAKDLAIDLTYIRIANLKAEDREQFRKEILDRIKMYQSGAMAMMTSSGTAVSVGGAASAWSTTENYHPVFGIGDITDFKVDSSEVYAERIARGDYS